MAYVTIAQAEAGTSGAHVALLLRAPAPLAVPGEAARRLHQRLRRVADGTARRLKTGAVAAYAAYPTVSVGFQAVTTTQGGRVVAGLAYSGRTVPAADGGQISLLDLLDNGSQAHDIVPRPDNPTGWLIWHDARGWHRAREVHHPGFSGHHYLPALFQAEEARFRAALAQAGQEALTDAV